MSAWHASFIVTAARVRTGGLLQPLKPAVAGQRAFKALQPPAA